MAKIVATERYIDQVIEQQIIQEQNEQDAEKVLQEAFTEGFATRLGTLNNVKYRLGHYDLATNKFDCVGFFKGYAVARGLLTDAEVGYINSYVMYSLGKPKLIQTARRGDVTYWQPIGNEPLRHIAFISRDYNKADGGLYVIDMLPGAKKPEERLIQLNGGNYLGRWKIKVASNPFVEIAKNKGLKYSPLWDYEGLYSLSRYYAPTEGQDSYFNGSYASDKSMNCGPGDCLITANGYKLKSTDVEKVVACPTTMPMGTKLRIEDWLTVTCKDRGGSIKGKRIDIWAGIGQEGLDNIRQNKVVTGKRNIYKFTYMSKPLNTTSKKLFILNSKGDFIYK